MATLPYKIKSLKKYILKQCGEPTKVERDRKPEETQKEKKMSREDNTEIFTKLCEDTRTAPEVCSWR